MNVLFVTDDLREADLIKSELEKYIPSFRLDISPGIPTAASKLAGPDLVDIVLLDTSVSHPDKITIAASIRKANRSTGVVALMRESDPTPHQDLIKAGIDAVVLKRAGFVASLPEAFQQAKRHHNGGNGARMRPLTLLYAGDFEQARRFLSGVPQLRLEEATFGTDGLLQLQEPGKPAPDLIVFDVSTTGTNTLKAIKDARMRASEIPIILLADPGNDELGVHAMRAGASDCITKTGNYFIRLLLSIQKELGRRELIREKTALKSREERLRHIVESMPVGVAVVSPDGTVMAVNDAGLKLIQRTRLDQIVGKALTDFFPDEERTRISAFLADVCGGTESAFRLASAASEAGTPALDFRGVPLHRDNKGTIAALVVLDVAPKEPETPGLLREYEEKIAALQTAFEKQEAKLKEAESLRTAAEAQQTQLKNAVEEITSRYEAALEEHGKWEEAQRQLEEQRATSEELAESLRAEQASWSLRAEELQQKCRAAEEEAAALKTALQNAQYSSSQAVDALNAELAGHQLIQKELEEKCRIAEDQLRSLNEEIARRDAIQNELEQKSKAAEEEAAALKTALQNAQYGSSQAVDALNAELAGHQLIQKELEEKCRVAEDQLRSLNEEIARRDAIQNELEQKSKAAEEEAAALKTALQNAQYSSSQAVDALNAELAGHQLIQKELEEKCRVAEDQLRSLDEEIARRDAIQNELEQKSKAAEEEAAALKTALQNAQYSSSQAVDALNEELARHQLIQKELEEKCRIAEDQLRSLNEEIARRDAIQNELEQKSKAAEEEAAALKTALQNAQYGSSQAVDALNAELAGHQLIQKELEEKCRVAEDQLRSLDEEIARRDAIQNELEQKSKAAEEEAAALKTALQNAQYGSSQAVDALNAELARHQLIQKELEEKCRVAEDQLRSLNEEIARRDAIQNELEQKSKAAEEEAAALKTALQNAQYSSSQAVDALNAELARHQLIQKELEEKCRIAEDQLRSLESSLQESEAILIQRTEASTAELFQCHVALKELERRYQAADRQVTDLVNTVASHEAEIARREVYCRELESKRAELQISLEEARKNCDNLKAASDESAARLAGLETALREWEQKYRASEEERIAAEARLSHATEEHKVEIAQWDQRRQEWESRLKVAEDQHAATLRSVTAEAESRVSRMAQECRAAAEHLGSARHELEQIKSASFDLHMKYQRLSQFASAAVVLATVDGDVVQCNDAAAQLFKRIDANDDAKFRIYSFEGALRERLLRDRKLEGVEWSGLDGDGKVIRLQENSTLLEATMDGQPLVERILSDISAIYNLREELRRTQKKQSAGDLAYATVRSLKELCTSLVRSGEILMETRNGEDLRDLAEAILHDANRGIKHARQFLSISRKTDRLPSLLSLNEVLATNETLLRNLISEDIELQMNLAERIGLIFAERQEIVQLISNLVASSREALPLGGTIAIETSDIEIDSSAGVDGLQPGIFVSMTVSADGCTVHPERRTASISTIVERMGGYIEITQTPQCGNVYRFYWPRIESLTQTAASITVPAEICEVTPPQEP